MIFLRLTLIKIGCLFLLFLSIFLDKRYLVVGVFGNIL